MKKYISLALAVLMVIALFAGCGNTGKGSSAGDGGMNIALITDVGNIDDESFNQSCWEASKEFAEANNLTCNYYRPSEDSTEARIEQINNAISKGANTIVCPGYLFEDAVYTAQDDNPGVNFILIDGEPHTADYSTYKTASNVYCILYQEEQAGYFAGYAAVKDGYTELGFCGGIDVPAVMRYGYGFVQGADAAAKEMGVNINIKYYYCGAFAPSDDLQTKMSAWYTEGTQVVFACGGSLYLSVVAAAEAAGTKVIGVDVDQSYVSDTVITSAMKQLKTSTKLALQALKDNGGKWPADYAGKTATLGASQDCTGLPTAEGSWRFKTFTVAEYEGILKGVADGSIKVSNSTDAKPEVSEFTTVDYQ